VKYLLRSIQKDDEKEFLNYIKGWENEEKVVPSSARLRGESFTEYLKTLALREKGLYLPDTHVACKTYILVDQEQIIYGVLNLRLSLNEHLLNYDGHIGYGINPKYRNQGFGKMILKLGLECAKKHGITDVLVTCNEENVASKKVIEACKGIFENKVYKTDGYILRYWIRQT
jgi:predicted acetyltransferase